MIYGVENGDIVLNYYTHTVYAFDSSNPIHSRDLFRSRFATNEEIKIFKAFFKPELKINELNVRERNLEKWLFKERYKDDFKGRYFGFENVTIHIDIDRATLMRFMKIGKKINNLDYLEIIKFMFSQHKETDYYADYMKIKKENRQIKKAVSEFFKLQKLIT